MWQVCRRRSRPKVRESRVSRRSVVSLRPGLGLGLFALLPCQLLSRLVVLLVLLFVPLPLVDPDPPAKLVLNVPQSLPGLVPGLALAPLRILSLPHHVELHVHPVHGELLKADRPGGCAGRALQAAALGLKDLTKVL